MSCKGKTKRCAGRFWLLPLNYREPVILYYFHEMDVSRAAQTMGLPEGTVKARLARARDLLRKRFPHLNPQAANLFRAAGKELSR